LGDSYRPPQGKYRSANAKTDPVPHAGDDAVAHCHAHGGSNRNAHPNGRADADGHTTPRSNGDTDTNTDTNTDTDARPPAGARVTGRRKRDTIVIMTDAAGPLTGIRVLDLTYGIGGPFCTKLLADYGADVLKIEPPAGDPARVAPFSDPSPLFLYLNTNKRSRVMDLDRAEERGRLLHLVDDVDVVVENFPPGQMAALGLGWEVLRARRPSLVLTSITPFGQDGPYAGYRATNLTVQALSGQMWLTGEPDREPLKQGGYQAEYQAGLNAFAATAIALFGARRCGRGAHLDIGAMPCMASVLEAAMPAWAYLGRSTGGRRGNVGSYAIGVYPCADGHLGIHAMPRNWAPLAETMGMPELATDERYATSRARLEHNDELVAMLYTWTAEQRKKDAYARAGGLRGPIAYVHTIQDLLDSPHLQARGYFHEVDHPRAGRLTYPGPPFRMSDSPWRAGRAPLLNESGPHPPAASANAGRGGAAAIAMEVGSPLPALAEAEPRSASDGRASLPLEGVRVLDLTMVWAGPYATRLLGDMGAEVIKVESPRFWDLLRALTFLPPETEQSWNKAAYFNHNNRDKLSLSLDLADARGRDVFLRLVAACDVVIENYRADVLDRLGLGYEALRAVKPDIILVSMPGHGKTGPERDYIAYGSNVEQLAGLVSLTGYEDGPPQKSGISYGDPIAGIAAAGAVALALLHRQRTGRGQEVELAQRETLTTLIGEAVVGYSMTGRLPARLGNRDPWYAPSGVYPCDPLPRSVEGATGGGDSWIAIACTTDAEFAALCRVIGRPELAVDPRYRERAARHVNQGELDAPISAWTRTRDQYAAMEALQAAGVPAGAVLSVPQVFDDPHLRARGFWEQVAHPDAGIWDMDGVAWRLRDHPAHIRIPAPRFGEHTAYVLHNLLGLTDTQIAELGRAGLTGDVPDRTVHQ
jgi:crotonobetainyl-CoA:carnitine CoA-transferase CaiB-like acyl-CoA transferase